MKVHYLPLDERPCNEAYIRHLYKNSEIVEIHCIDKNLLGNKKIPASWDNIKFFLEKDDDFDASVLSLDMFFYGGLIPSRLHELKEEQITERFNYLENYAVKNKNTKIYAFQTLMRTPHYNSSEEEPEYYGTYGESIFRQSYLKDKEKREGLNEEEKKELSNIEIPKEVLDDYEKRRKFNLGVLKKSLDFVSKGYLDFLVIPQDDSAKFGYTARDQKEIYEYIEKKSLWNKVMIYPGADEVGLSLTSRAILKHLNETFKVYPFYSSTLGPYIVPMYEDRPMFETLKSHLQVIGVDLAYTPSDADFILAINSPGLRMEEAFEQKRKDVSYTSHRQLGMFIHQIQQFISSNKKVALLDVAFSNGGDIELANRLDQLKVLEKLVAYSAWNTHANSLGTLLSMITIMYIDNDCEKFKGFTLSYRLIEDLLYQSVVRQHIIENTLPLYKASYYDFNGNQKAIEIEIMTKLKQIYENMSIAETYPFKVKKVYMPWQRMFEIGMTL